MVHFEASVFIGIALLSRLLQSSAFITPVNLPRFSSLHLKHRVSSQFNPNLPVPYTYSLFNDPRFASQFEGGSETEHKEEPVTESKSVVISPDEDPAVAKLRIQAEKLRLQAEKMKVEAEKEELILQTQKLEEKETQIAQQDKLISQLRILDDDALKVEVKKLLGTRKIDANVFLRIAELCDKTENESEIEDLQDFSNRLMSTIEEVDGGLAVALSKTISEKTTGFQPNPDLNIELSQREMLNQWLVQNNISDENGEFEKAINEQLLQVNGQNMTLGSLGGLIALPTWIPPPLLRYLLQAPTSLPKEDLEVLKTEIFGQDSFYVTGTDSCEFAFLIRGNPRGDEKEIFAKVNAALQKNSTLAENYQLFYCEDPTPASPDQMGMGMVPDPQPVFIITSTNVKPPEVKWGFYGLGLSTFFASLLTAYTYGLGTFALNPTFLKALEAGDISVADKPFPVVAGIFAIMAIHEIGHFAAASKWGLKISPPVLLPSLQIGTYGAVTRLLDFPSNRRALFDFAAAGPLAGGLASIALLAFGLMMTAGASPEALASFPVVPASLFHSSLLAGIISVFTAPTVITAQISSAVPVHPLAIAGLSGLIANALNFMPIGQLDGGRAALAAFGRRSAALLGFLTLIVQAIVGFTQPYSIQFYWGLVVIFFQRQLEIPTQDEVTPLDQERSLGLFLGFLLTVFTLIPFPELG